MPKRGERVDFADVAERALAAVELVLDRVAPGGKRQGAEYVVRNPTRADQRAGSFKVNLRTGAWSDFATGDAGGDLVSLWAYIEGCTQAEAAAEVGKLVGGTPRRRKPAAKEQDRRTWTPVLPAPEDAPQPPRAHRHYGRYTARWSYRDGDGRLLGYVCRFDHKERGKEILPLTWCAGDRGETGWQWRSWDQPRPLYGIDRLAAQPDAPVLVVEGEKCADAAQQALGNGWACVSWPGGSKAVGKADWGPLGGRTVTIWPDNDVPGRAAAAAVVERIAECAQDVRICEPPAGEPKGWDVADAIADGWDADRIERFLGAAGPWREMDVSVSGAGDDFAAPAAAPPWAYHPTDTGGAQVLADRFGETIRYNAKPFGAWFHYLDGCWREDRTNRIYCLVDEVIRGILAMAADTADQDARKKLEKWAWGLEAMSRQKSLVAKAETMQSLAVRVEDLDADGWLFNCRNGTIDLSSGEPVFRGHRPEDYLTKQSPVSYDPDAECPEWRKFCHRIFAEDEALIGFIQRAVGYSLVADVSEQKLFFAYGTGANGKSVFFETLRYLLGDYGGKCPTEMLMQQQYNQVPTDVADLRGLRFVVASEIDEGKRWAESRLKDLTGGDMVKARRMREDYFEFPQTHKLWVFGNHKPNLRNADEGIKRRLRIVPFTVTIPEEERIPLGQLLGMLRAEASGILNWALEGYVRWREDGLGMPGAVDEATREYFDDQDIVLQFIQECCITGDAYQTVGKRLWEKYHGWCQSNGMNSVSSKTLFRMMQERGYEKTTGHGNKTVIRGLDLEQEYDNG